MDHNSPEHDWEACPKCVEQAKQDEILGPDAKPFLHGLAAEYDSERRTEILAECPRCGSEVVDETGEGEKIECTNCPWTGGYEDA